MKIVLILIGAAWVVCATVEAGKGKACDNGGTHKLPCTAEEDQEMQCLNGGTCFALRIGQSLSLSFWVYWRKMPVSKN
ncbi:hypothetical protein pdam_00023272 [Pocillopora damicornis]|uniref:Uncharacterized protein n=1 Tax=Pocillopora damicornis TaxID=46731 RepID=A0A3M6TYN5_POCDA|nr:hypothetical protein pdam_00023272 [Pocillopora damicornis]